MSETYRRGDMYYADLGQGIGSEQKGTRPVVIIQNNVGNKHSPTVIIAAITSKTHVKAKALHRIEERVVFRRVVTGVSGVRIPKALTARKLPDVIVYKLEKLLKQFIRENGL